jgi:hypothetical protein
MMSILFPHLCEDVEFLVPLEEDTDVEMRDFSAILSTASASAGAGTSASSYPTSPPSRSNRHFHENAVAGPSRLG